MFYKKNEVQVISRYEVNGVSWVLVEDVEGKGRLQVVPAKDLKNDKG